jgi:hypothetical protein
MKKLFFFTFLLSLLYRATAAPVCSIGERFVCPIYVDHTLVPSDQNYQAILLTDANLPANIFTYAKSDGSDIRIADDIIGATQNAIDVVFFDAVNKHCEIWFTSYKVLRTTSDTYFYVFYGNPYAPALDPTSEFGRNNCWSAGFEHVHHFQEASGTLVNSAGNTFYDGTSANLTYAQAGKFTTGSKCAHFTAASNSKVTLGANSLTLENKTLMAWIKLTSFGGAGGGRIFSNETSAHQTGNGLAVRNGAAPLSTIQTINDQSSNNGTANAIGTGAWYFVALTHTNATPAIWNLYVNGVLTGTANTSNTLSDPGNYTVIGMCANATDRNFDGDMDEVKNLYLVYSANQILLQYRLESEPGTIIKVGTPVDISGCDFGFNF